MTDRGHTDEGADQAIPDQFTLTELDQLKVIADPLRVRLLQAFCEAPRTTKQVADSFGEKPTRLYHHVDALERVGLIRLVETRQVRGTIEKYYTAVAKRFRADPALLRGEDTSGPEALADTVEALFDSAATELRDVIRANGDSVTGDEGLVSYVEVRADEQFVTALRKRLFQVLEDLERDAPKDPPIETQRRFRLLLAYYPLDRGGSDSNT